MFGFFKKKAHTMQLHKLNEKEQNKQNSPHKPAGPALTAKLDENLTILKKTLGDRYNHKEVQFWSPLFLPGSSGFRGWNGR
ncbi:hypothetical protein ASZ90_018060 [hydrocarbon metagenome]|uniref:Uncharacterized protein n=1 Tax=hydrocarbon metagenome TaxID=938273 RepID=A0A0W8E7F8_9ZZZZ